MQEQTWREAVCRSRPEDKQFAGADLETSSLREQTWRQAVYGNRSEEMQFAAGKKSPGENILQNIRAGYYAMANCYLMFWHYTAAGCY